MRLRRLDLARYGKFTDESIDFGPAVAGTPDMHLIYGPNEAGKSTTFAAYLDLLFGIEMQSRYNFRHPYPTMRIGACLELSTGVRELTRVKRASPSLREGDDPVADGLVTGELGGMDRTAYRTMFSLDDETLEAGGKSILASNGELGQLLFSASAGLSELSRTLAGLRLRSEDFQKRSGELSRLKAEFAALETERRTTDTLASSYRQMADERTRAAQAYDAADAELAGVRARGAAVQKRLAALPRMAALVNLREQQAALGPLPDAPPGWLDELPALGKAATAHRSDREHAEAEVARLAHALALAVLDTPALALAEGLGRLERMKAKSVSADIDLPERRRELGTEEQRVAEVLARLGRPGEPQPARLLLDVRQAAALRTLIEGRSGVDTDLATAGREREQATRQMSEAARAFQEAGGIGAARPAGVRAVAEAVVTARDSDHGPRLRTATRERTQRDRALVGQLAALAPWAGTAAELAALRVPDRTTVVAWDTDGPRHADRAEQWRDAQRKAEGEAARSHAELAAIGEGIGLVTDRAAAAVRGARETAWAEHRRRLDPDTADAFEAALRQDDVVADARIGRERELARLHLAAQTSAAKSAEAAHAAEQAQAAEAAHALHLATMASAVAAIHRTLPPDMAAGALLGWIDRRAAALATWTERERFDVEAVAAEADAAALRARLAAALQAAAIPHDATAALDGLIAAADGAVAQADAVQALSRRLDECRGEVSRRDLAAEQAGRSDRMWRAKWAQACAGCWLGEAGALPEFDVVRETLGTLAELGPALGRAADLQGRIGAMEDDQAGFGRELDRLATELGMTRGPTPPLAFAAEVQERVRAAVQARDDRAKLEADLERARQKHVEIEAAASRDARRAAEMMAYCQAGTLLEVGGRLRDMQRAAELARQIRDAEAEIVGLLGTATLAEAAALLQGADPDALGHEQAALAARTGALEQRTRELHTQKIQAEDRIAFVGGDDAVARIEERRRTKRLEIEDRARRHLRLRAGIAAADRALRAYRDLHQSAMMAQASDAFRLLSRGAYLRLGTQPERDGDVLVAIGADGGSKLATDLSKGTRFQLYLALRAAGYREFARTRHPVPFVADDIMETFDDFRAEEALRLFADMARVGQVIYLTHHDHLVAIAERILPGVHVHRLAAA